MPVDPLSMKERPSPDGPAASSVRHRRGRQSETQDQDGIFRDEDDDHHTSGGISSFQRRHDFWHTLAVSLDLCVLDAWRMVF